jgi:uncharacterized Ntn-hydrolase superfamily protein
MQSCYTEIARILGRTYLICKKIYSEIRLVVSCERRNCSYDTTSTIGAHDEKRKTNLQTADFKVGDIKGDIAGGLEQKIMLKPSTFSIVACDLAEQAWGVAVASKFLAAGAVVPWAQAGRGAVATQSYANTSFGPRGLRLMAEGVCAQDALDQLLAEDEGREQRQVGLVDSQGRAATFTGSECFDWAGGLTGPGYAIQGNILAGEAVVQAMQTQFLGTDGQLPSRLYAALLAGDRAGGDRRGKQSAAILVVKPGAGYGGFNDCWMDYRVDDHEDPILELGQLLNLHELYFGESDPKDRIQLTGEPLQQLQQIAIRKGYLNRVANGQYDAASKKALRMLTGNENFEERCNLEEGWMDRPVYDYLIKKFGV